jgi:hypothetical protein
MVDFFYFFSAEANSEGRGFLQKVCMSKIIKGYQEKNMFRKMKVLSIFKCCVLWVAGIVVLGFYKYMLEGKKYCALCAIWKGRLETDSYFASADMDIHLCLLDRCNYFVCLLSNSICFMHSASAMFYWNFLWCFIKPCSYSSYVDSSIFRKTSWCEMHCFLCEEVFALKIFPHPA